MTEKQKYAIKLAIGTMDKYISRYWNTRYGSSKTGVSVWYSEAIGILSDMVRDNNDSKHTNVLPVEVQYYLLRVVVVITAVKN